MSQTIPLHGLVRWELGRLVFILGRKRPGSDIPRRDVAPAPVILTEAACQRRYLTWLQPCQHNCHWHWVENKLVLS